MNNIMHKVEFTSSVADLYQALTDTTGLSAWWTKAEQTSDVISFAFGPKGEHVVKMQIMSKTENKQVKWICAEGPWQGIGEFTFDLSDSEQGACLRFCHDGWSEADDFYMHCNCKWAFFFAVSLKNYLETGRGAPHPNDPNM